MFNFVNCLCQFLAVNNNATLTQCQRFLRLSIHNVIKQNDICTYNTNRRLNSMELQNRHYYIEPIINHPFKQQIRDHPWHEEICLLKVVFALNVCLFGRGPMAF